MARRRSKSSGGETLIGLGCILAIVVWICRGVWWVMEEIADFWNSLGFWHWVLSPVALGLTIWLLTARAKWRARKRREQAARDAAAADRVRMQLAEQAARDAERRRLAAERQAAMDKEFAITHTMSGSEFEELVARLLRRDGYPDAHVVGGAGDLGADVIAYSPDTTRKIVVQCKCYHGHKVGSKDMQAFLGTVFHHHNADVAVYVTTDEFTGAAEALAESRGVHLVDGRQFAEWQAFGAPEWLKPSTVDVPRQRSTPVEEKSATETLW